MPSHIVVIKSAFGAADEIVEAIRDLDEDRVCAISHIGSAFSATRTLAACLYGKGIKVKDLGKHLYVGPGIGMLWRFVDPTCSLLAAFLMWHVFTATGDKLATLMTMGATAGVCWRVFYRGTSIDYMFALLNMSLTQTTINSTMYQLATMGDDKLVVLYDTEDMSNYELMMQQYAGTPMTQITCVGKRVFVADVEYVIDAIDEFVETVANEYSWCVQS